MNKRLMKTTGIYFIGNLSSKIMSALLIPIYAFYVTTEDFGYYDFTQTIMNILNPIILLAIWEAILKFVLLEEKKGKKERIISTSTIFTLFMLVLFVFGASIFSIVSNKEMPHLALVVFMMVINSIVTVWQYYARSLSNKLYVISGVSSTIINFIFTIILIVFLKTSLTGLFISYILGQISIFLIIESKLRILKRTKFSNFDIKLLTEMLVFSSPLVLNLVSAWFMSGFARSIVTVNLGVKANGLYSFANKFSLIITMLGSVVTMAIIEEAILSVKNKKIQESFNKTLENLFVIFQTLAILSIPAISIFYKFIADTEYYHSFKLAPWLILYSLFNIMASHVGSVFQAIDKTKYQFTTTMLGAVATVVISTSLIGVMGVSAVVSGQVIGALLMLTSRYVLVRRFTDIRVDWTPSVIRIIIFVLVAIISLKAPIYIVFIVEILMMIFFVYKYKTIIKKVK
ncbi:lipopolysaccharide biosynthesis protein [Enterococcus sp. LJL98]